MPCHRDLSPTLNLTIALGVVPGDPKNLPLGDTVSFLHGPACYIEVSNVDNILMTVHCV